MNPITAAVSVAGLLFAVPAFAAPLPYGLNPPPPPGEHPRICLVPAELPELRERVKSGPAKSGYEASLQVIKDLSPGGSQFNFVEQLEKGAKVPELDRQKLSSNLRDAALAALIAEDPAKTEAVKRVLLAFVRGVPPVAKDMDSSRNAPGVGFAYDWIYASLSEAERAEVRQWIAKVCAETEAGLDKEIYGFKPGVAERRTFNWIPFVAGAFGVAALSIEGEAGYEPRWFDKTAASQEDFLKYGISDQGCPEESIHYVAYGMANGAYFFDAMARRGHDVWQDPHLTKLPIYWTYDLFPFGPDFNAMQDTRDLHTGIGEIYHRLNLAWPQDPVMNWVYNQYNANSNGGSLAKSSTVLWAQPPVPNLTAAGLKLPPSKYFEHNGLLYARSSWDKDAAYLSFQSDPVGAGPSHMHADRNAFTFAALGRLWAIDPGGWIPQDIFHNTVLIDGKAEGYFPQRGRIVSYQDKGFATAITGDAKLAYGWGASFKDQVSDADRPQYQDVSGFYSKPYNPVDRANRTAVLVRGAHPYVIVSDDLRKDTQPHRYTWQMMTPTTNHAVQTEASKVILEGTGGGPFLAPDPDTPDRTRGAIKADFQTPADGQYRLWLFMGHETYEPWFWGVRVSLDGAADQRVNCASGDSAHPHWQAAGEVRSLSAGKHTLALKNWGNTRLIAALVAPEGFDLTEATLRPTNLPAGASLMQLTDLPVAPGWKLFPGEAAAPRLLVQAFSLAPSESSFGRFDLIRPDTKENKGVVNRLSFSTNAVEPQFRVLLLPHRAGEVLPQISGNTSRATIRWADGTMDEWSFGPKVILRRNGKNQTLEIAAN